MFFRDFCVIRNGSFRDREIINMILPIIANIKGRFLIITVRQSEFVFPFIGGSDCSGVKQIALCIRITSEPIQIYCDRFRTQ